MYKHLNSEQRYAIYLILKEYVPKRHCGCYSGKPLNDSTPVGTIQKMDKNRTRATIRASRITLEPYRKWIKTITTDNGSESFRHEYITRRRRKDQGLGRRQSESFRHEYITRMDEDKGRGRLGQNPSVMSTLLAKSEPATGVLMSESFRHEYITRKLGIIVYFADPHAPWQKGSIENTNGLIKQYIPNGTDFKNVSLQRIKMIQRKINARPREKLNFLTPDEVGYKKTL